MIRVFHSARVLLCLASPLILNSSGMSTIILFPPATSSPPAPTVPRGVSCCESPGTEPPKHPGAPKTSYPWPASCLGKEIAPKWHCGVLKEKGLWRPTILVEISALPASFYITVARLLSQTESQFPHQFYGCDGVKQRLVSSPWLLSAVMRAGLMNVAQGSSFRGYMKLVLVQRTPRLVNFCASYELISPGYVMNSFPQAVSWTHFPRLCLRALHPSQKLIVFL